MKVEELEMLLPKIKKIDLKAWEAHKMLAPPKRDYVNIDIEDYKKASVLALLYPKNGEVHIALIKRATYNGKHSGQIAFPGGKQEKEDKTNWETAIRETQEEIGVLASEITFLKAMTPVPISVSNFIVYPFLAVVNNTPKFILQKEEVAGIVEIQLSSFLENTFELVNISNKPENEFVVPSFLYNDHLIWGATAMMLNELKILFIDSMEL